MEWKDNLKADPTDWLLSESNPSVRLWVLKELFDKKDNSAQVKQAQDQVMKSNEVTSIFSAQEPGGYWVHREDMYLPKYKATTHQLLILAEMGATRTHMIEKAIEHVFQFQRNNGHFLTKLPKSKRGKDSVVKDGCCFDGNILYYLSHFGYLGDPRTKRLLEFINNYYDKENTGWKCRAYPINPQAVFPINCYMGAIKILKAFSWIPESKRCFEMNEIIFKETEKILENRVFKYLRNPDGTRKDKAGWKRFGFPLFYQSDLLEVMDTLTRLNIKDDRMQDSINIIHETQQKDGKWLLKDTFNGKMWVDIEKKNKPSRWITLRAMRVLRKWYKF
jgi:hypothetical protein